MTFTLRTATENDIHQLLPLVLDSQRVQKEEIEGDTIEDRVAFEKGWRQSLTEIFQDSHKQIFVAEDTNERTFVGYIMCFLDAALSGRSSIADLYVAPEKRGTGLAQTLMEEATKWAKKNGSTQMFLGVHRDNISARSLYDSLGFYEIPDHYVTLKKDL